MTFVLVELEDEDALRAVPTISGVVIAELDEGWNQSFIGTYFYVRFADSEDGTLNLRTRMIKGLLEDPATRSAASTVTGYLSLEQGKPNQTLKFAVTQGVEMGRRSNIGVEVGKAETHCIGLVNLFGKAVQVMKVDLKPKWSNISIPQYEIVDTEEMFWKSMRKIPSNIS
jgi:predicted PhzF superfamily epimerase YddE/YHI9